MYDAIGCTCQGIQPTVPKYLPLIFSSMLHMKACNELQLQLSYSEASNDFPHFLPTVSPRDYLDSNDLSLSQPGIPELSIAAALNRCSSHYRIARIQCYLNSYISSLYLANIQHITKQIIVKFSWLVICTLIHCYNVSVLMLYD